MLVGGGWFVTELAEVTERADCVGWFVIGVTENPCVGWFVMGIADNCVVGWFGLGVDSCVTCTVSGVEPAAAEPCVGWFGE
jgi:hypothetical protein